MWLAALAVVALVGVVVTVRVRRPRGVAVSAAYCAADWQPNGMDHFRIWLGDKLETFARSQSTVGAALFGSYEPRGISSDSSGGFGDCGSSCGGCGGGEGC